MSKTCMPAAVVLLLDPSRDLTPPLRARFTPDGERISADAGAGDSVFYREETRDGAQTSRFELKIVKPSLDTTDIRLFEEKVAECVQRMAKRRSLRLWDFAINFRYVNDVAPLFVVRLEVLVSALRRERVDAYCYGAHPSSELGLALRRGRPEEWLLRDAAVA